MDITVTTPADLEIKVRIPADLVPCVQMHIDTQKRIESDPATGGQRVIRLFDDVEDFVDQVVAQAVLALARTFPNNAMRQKMIAEKQAQEAALELACPKLAARRAVLKSS